MVCKPLCVSLRRYVRLSINVLGSAILSESEPNQTESKPNQNGIKNESRSNKN